MANSNALYRHLFGSTAMDAIFTETRHLQGLLDFEAALARVEGRLGIIPPLAGEAIPAKCLASLFDFDALAREAADAGNLAIPMLRQLTALVSVEAPEAAAFIHWGATSQDAQDSGVVLQLRQALKVFEDDLERLSEGLAGLAERHRRTALAGRTWLQQALPITFGVKAAGWLSAVERQRTRLAELKPRLLVLQFGGAAGTLAALGDKGMAVAEGLAADLSLGLPDLPWHSQRDRIAEIGCWAALLTGTLGKIARDVSLLMQSEVGEAFESAADGRGGSSSMPQKRNPVSCAAVLAAAGRTPELAATLLNAMVQEHERGLGGWQAEWTSLPDLLGLAGGALAQAVHIVEGLRLDPRRMAANLELGHGTLMAESVKVALAAKTDPRRAAATVAAACRNAEAQGRPLGAVLAEDKEVAAALSRQELRAVLDPSRYLGASEAFIDRVLAARRRG